MRAVQGSHGLKMQSEPKIPLVVLLGPTAVGKTELSLQIAETLGGEIVSADSRLLYRGMDIGTAKPGWNERKRVPHHLIDVANPDEIWSLPMYQLAAGKAIQEIYQRGNLPFLVGGTGQYIWSLVQGWQPPQVAPDPKTRAVLDAWGRKIGSETLHRQLSLLDPEAAIHIEANNLRRVLRALEVIFTTERKFSEQRRRGDSQYNSLLIGLTRSRQEIYARVDQRIDQMLADGWVEEVRDLLNQGFDPQLSALSAIGYREICAYLKGKCTLDEAVKLVKRQTRVFIRRQANWFKLDDPSINWFEMNDAPKTKIMELIRLNFNN